MQPLHHRSILWKSPNELICSHIHIAYLPLGVNSHQSLCLSDVRSSPIFARVTYNQFTPPARPDSSQRRRRRDADATVLSDLGWRCERGIMAVVRSSCGGSCNHRYVIIVMHTSRFAHTWTIRRHVDILAASDLMASSCAGKRPCRVVLVVASYPERRRSPRLN